MEGAPHDNQQENLNCVCVCGVVWCGVVWCGVCVYQMVPLSYPEMKYLPFHFRYI